MVKRTRYLLAAGTLGLWSLALGQEAGPTTTPTATRRPAGAPDPAWLDQSLRPLMASATQVGRFQLFEAQHPKTPEGKQLYRIDTVTGQVWSLTSTSVPLGTGDEQAVVGWLPVSEKEIFWYFQAMRESQKPKQPVGAGAPATPVTPGVPGTPVTPGASGTPGTKR